MSFCSVDVIPNPSDSGSGGNTSLNDYLIQPYGTVIQSASGRNPYGYLMCDGEIYSKDLYPDLQTALGQVYQYQSNVGSLGTFDPVYDFVIPNLMDASTAVTYKTLLFNGGTSNFSQPGALTGGANTVVLNASNVPSHSHALTNNTLTYTAAGAITAVQATTGTVSGQTGTGIYNSSGTLVVAGGAAATAVDIRNSYNSLASLIRSSYTVPSTYVPGYVNFTSANNQFYFIYAAGSTVSTATLYACPVSLPTGAYTALQVMNNLAIAFKNALISEGYVSATGNVIANNYSTNRVGNWVCKMNVPPVAQSGLLSFLGFCGMGFSSTAPSYKAVTYHGATISNAILDATATTLGFFTRQYSTSYVTNQSYLWGTGGTLGTQKNDYIYSPKPLNFYFGSVADGTMTINTIPNVINSF